MPAIGVALLSVPSEMNGLSVCSKPQDDHYQQSEGLGQDKRDGTSKLNLSIASSLFLMTLNKFIIIYFCGWRRQKRMILGKVRASVVLFVQDHLVFVYLAQAGSMPTLHQAHLIFFSCKQ